MPDICISNVLVAELQSQLVQSQCQLVESETELIDEYAFSKKLHLRLPGDVVLLQSQQEGCQVFWKF
jgi:hypothetical protein